MACYDNPAAFGGGTARTASPVRGEPLRRWTRRYSSQRDEFYHAKQPCRRDVGSTLFAALLDLLEVHGPNARYQSRGMESRLHAARTVQTG